MKCAELFSQIALLPGAALDAEERDRIREHLKDCPACAKRLGDLDRAYETFKEPLPAVAVDKPALFDKVMGSLEERRLVEQPVDSQLAIHIALSCCYCHDAITRQEACYCASCLSLHHTECFSIHGHCSAPGCAEVFTVRPDLGPAEHRPARRRGRLGIVLGLVLSGVAGIAALSYYKAQHEQLRVRDRAALQRATQQSELEELRVRLEMVHRELAEQQHRSLKQTKESEQIRQRFNEQQAQLEKVKALSQVIEEAASPEAWQPQLREGTRALVVAGAPSWEFRYLRSLLKREPKVQLSTWLQSADPAYVHDGDRPIKTLPRTESELFAYDLIFLLDPQIGDADVPWLELLRRFVSEQGGGLCYVAGDTFTSEMFRNSRLRALQELLPVLSDPSTADEKAAGSRQYTEARALRLSDRGARHDLTRLARDRSRSEALWVELPGFYWLYPIQAIPAGAEVLVRARDVGQRRGTGNTAVLVTKSVGKGRTVFAASDETWRWRALALEIYERYWLQMVRTLDKGRRRTR